MKKPGTTVDGADFGVKDPPLTLLTRREVLKSAVLTGGAAVILHHGTLVRAASGIRMYSRADAPAQLDLLNHALRHEYQTIQAYQVAEESGLIKDGLYDGVNMYRFQHLDEHVETLKTAIADLGGNAVAAPAKPKSTRVAAGADLGAVLRGLLDVEVRLADLYDQIVKDTNNEKLRAALEEIKLDETIHQRFYRYVLSQK